MVFTKKEFGDLTAMTRESAVRILQQFRNEGIVSINGSLVTINDKKKLQTISDIG